MPNRSHKKQKPMKIPLLKKLSRSSRDSFKSEINFRFERIPGRAAWFAQKVPFWIFHMFSNINQSNRDTMRVRKSANHAVNVCDNHWFRKDNFPKHLLTIKNIAMFSLPRGNENKNSYEWCQVEPGGFEDWKLLISRANHIKFCIEITRFRGRCDWSVWWL